MRLIPFLLSALILSLMTNTHCFSQPAITANTVLIRETNFNNDSLPDKFFGTFDSTGKIIPSFILWGRNDSTRQADSITRFQYPNWSNLRISYDVQNYDKNDAISDIIFILRGNLDPDNVSSKDSILIVAIMGGRGLDSIHDVNLGDLPRKPDTLFTRVFLRPQSGLTEPAIRDLSNIISYRIPKITLQNGTASYRSAPVTEEQPQPALPDAETSVISVYPNPISSEASINYTNIPAGEYFIKLLDQKGCTVYTGTHSVDRGTDIVKQIDLGTITDGAYFLCVSSGDKSIGTFKIVVLH